MADPRVLIQNLLYKNFPKFGGIRKSCTYKSIAFPAAYDIDTGIVSTTFTDYTGIMIIFDEITSTINIYPKFKRDDESFLSIDKVAIFPSLALAVEPKVGDVIVDNANVNWKVQGVATDPASGHYALHVRPS
jgi:hypothetical protein